MNIEKIAYSRIAEPLSKGENVKKLLSLHISPYADQVTNAKTLENLKSIEKTGGAFLEWFGVLKGILRPKTTLGTDLQEHFFSFFHNEPLSFETVKAKPFYFNQKLSLSISDDEFKTIIKAYCMLTGFRGTTEEYSYFFKEVFGFDVFILLLEYDLSFIIEGSSKLNIDKDLVKALTPILPSTKNSFNISPYSLFVWDFPNIKGSKLDFDENTSTSFYFPI